MATSVLRVRARRRNFAGPSLTTATRRALTTSVSPLLCVACSRLETSHFPSTPRHTSLRTRSSSLSDRHMHMVPIKSHAEARTHAHTSPTLSSPALIEYAVVEDRCHCTSFCELCCVVSSSSSCASEVVLSVGTLRIRAQPKPFLGADWRLGRAPQRQRVIWCPLVRLLRRPLRLGLHLLLERRRRDVVIPSIPRDLHHGVLRDICRWALLARAIPIPQQVGAQHTQRRLVRHNQQRLLVRVQLMNQRLEARDQVEVRLAVWVARRELVHLAVLAKARVGLGDLLLGHAVVRARI